MALVIAVLAGCSSPMDADPVHLEMGEVHHLDLPAGARFDRTLEWTENVTLPRTLEGGPRIGVRF